MVIAKYRRPLQPPVTGSLDRARYLSVVIEGLRRPSVEFIQRDREDVFGKGTDDV
jgi:hypothetical protein